jgi:spore coat-associated protein N
MKNIKKALIGTTLAGVLIAGAGAGTYSWFNASYKASGEITNHTLTINDVTDASDKLFEDSEKLAPSRFVEDSFSIENTGTMNQIVRAKLDLALFDGETNIGTPDKSVYSIDVTGTFTRDGQTHNISLPGISAQELDDFIGNNTWIPDENGADDLGEEAYFQPGDKLDLNLKVTLDEGAGNEYQGLTLKGAVEVDGRQVDDGSQFGS